ncbi:MAG: hypothetical protein JSV25_06045 [Spirochaetota bacterium]|nr:MAG: hypothetical protein JSV25_06045 [Spirochaetota bacterium]
MHKKRFIVIVFLAIILCMVPVTLLSGPYSLNVIDTPTTFISYKGDLNFDFTMYDNGGILGAGTLAVSDYILLGLYFDVGRLIGSDDVQFYQPGVIAKFLISDGSGVIPPIAIGYSYFMTGDVHRVDGQVVNGIYIVASQSFFLFENEQYFYFGLRYPIIPLSYSHPRNINLFLSTDFMLTPEFSVKGEIENIHFSENRGNEIFYNLGFELNIVDLVTLGLDLKYSPGINRVVRLLKIGYTTQF